MNGLGLALYVLASYGFGTVFRNKIKDPRRLERTLPWLCAPFWPVFVLAGIFQDVSHRIGRRRG